jgi:VIT1/CCC1 family predicted Fe2+/Mn2+ transporter
MFRERYRQRRRKATPPRETILSNILGLFLDPIDALFTIFFSILFALLFTLSYSILIYHGIISSSFASGYGQELFFTIMGAVTAWGLIDGILYVLGESLARRERYRLLQYVQTSTSEEEAVSAIAYELDFILEPITSGEQRHALYRDIRIHLSQAEPQAIVIQREDVSGATATVLLSVVSVLPSLLPLLLLPDNTALAIRISNLLSFLVIFAAGYSWGLHTATNPWKTGLLLSSLCMAMVLVAIVLGG